MNVRQRLIKRGAHGATRRINQAGRTDCKLADTLCCEAGIRALKAGSAGSARNLVRMLRARRVQILTGVLNHATA
ncbi:hypothetical protein BSU04_20310 [Caballeronia sordidicola]|uniref:Uncharacterized protein n=1 Tax=Caballeronia sordidicola TaxID=196367 RepID=A0A226WZZ1_CABSO|nr:hypothetical protein BSU04_20310 [Caballeronia sordidicola]